MRSKCVERSCLTHTERERCERHEEFASEFTRKAIQEIRLMGEAYQGPIFDEIPTPSHRGRPKVAERKRA